MAIVAPEATITPFPIVMSAVAPDPLPVIVTRFTPLYVNCPLDGVYPIPGFSMSRLPVAVPAVQTKLAEPNESVCVMVLQNLKSASAIPVSNDNLCFLEIIFKGFGSNLGI